MALALLAALLRATIPIGFMPAAAGGTVSIVICGGHGPAFFDIKTGALTTPRNGKPEPAGRPKVCPFATAAHLAAPPALPGAFARALPAADIVPALLVSLTAVALAAPPPPARAPPVTF